VRRLHIGAAVPAVAPVPAARSGPHWAGCLMTSFPLMLVWLIPWLAFTMWMDRRCARNPRLGLWWYGLFTVADAAIAATAFTSHRWGLALAFTIFALLAAWMWYDCWNKRRKKRAPKLAGYKGRALMERLLSRQREAVAPAR
jgi:hypothetical protein